ncbi:hypothetical protein ACFV6E_17990 [Streptomyces sp. NPDC059785]|uniref:hypothetical protein n=1 Tax=unclassified Streptomyces TaxID=2593676 RepID=UPI00365EB2C6
MRIRGSGIKLTATLGLVVLALTGFSSRGHGHSSHGSGGGGCSSSSQDHDSSSSTSGGSSSGGSTYDDDSYDDDYYDDDDDDSTSSGSTGGYNRRPTHRSTSSASGSGLKDGTVKLVSCATQKRKYATVEVTNPNKSEQTFSVYLAFQDADDTAVAQGTKEVEVPAKGTVTTQVPVDDDTYLDELDHCTANEVASLAD